MKIEKLTAFEQAAEECSDAFDRLDDDDKRALLVRMLAVGALHMGDIDFIEEVADDARQTVLDFVSPASSTSPTH